MLGANEERSDTYKGYVERVPEFATTQLLIFGGSSNPLWT